MTKTRKALVYIAALLVLGSVVGAVLVAGLRLLPPHEIKPPDADVAPRLRTALVSSLLPHPSVGELTTAVLQITDDNLHFGLSHRTTLTFGAPREGNCIEYARLFAALFNVGATRAGLRARAFAVHSARARV